MLKKIATAWDKHGASLLTAVSIVTEIGAIIATIKATPEVIDILEDMQKREEEGEELSAIDKIKELGPTVAPAALLTVISIGTNIAGSKWKSDKLGTAVQTASILQLAAERRKKAEEEVLTDEQIMAIDQRIADKQIAENPPVTPQGRELTNIYNTGHGNDIFVDEYGRYFRSSKEYLRRMTDHFNVAVLDIDPVEKKSGHRPGEGISHPQGSVNDLTHEYWGLPECDAADREGWNGRTERELQIRFYPSSIGGDILCWKVEFYPKPFHNFRDDEAAEAMAGQYWE